MDLYSIIFIVLTSAAYILYHIKKVLTKGEENPKCANCSLQKIYSK